MAITATDIKDKWDEFDATSATRIDAAIAEADRRVNATQWGSRADDGLKYLTAHILKHEKLGDGLPAGALSSKRVGPISASIQTVDLFSKSALGATSYGRYFLDLQNLAFPSRVIA